MRQPARFAVGEERILRRAQQAVDGSWHPPETRIRVLEASAVDLRRWLGRQPHDAELRRDLEITLNKIGDCRLEAREPALSVAAHREALASKNLEPAPLASLEDALPAFLSAQTYDKELVLPWYGRGW